MWLAAWLKKGSYIALWPWTHCCLLVLAWSGTWHELDAPEAKMVAGYL